MEFTSSRHPAELDNGWTFVMNFPAGMKSGYVKSLSGDNLSVSPSGSTLSFTNKPGDENLAASKVFTHSLEFYRFGLLTMVTKFELKVIQSKNKLVINNQQPAI